MKRMWHSVLAAAAALAAAADGYGLRMTEAGVYSAVAVTIQNQRQPESCAHFLDNLEVSRGNSIARHKRALALAI